MIFMIKNFRKYSITVLFSATLIMIITGSAYPEALFLKDGSISDGSVITETDQAVKFKFTDGNLKEIPRKDILRVLHHTDYNQKRYIYKTDNSLVEAFIVEEDKLTYTYRIDLKSPNEFKMQKSEVETISKKKIDFASDTKEKVMTREENIETRASRWRFGASIGGPFDATAEYSVKALSIRGITLDFFPYRMRDAKGNGLDWLLRGNVNVSNFGEKDFVKLGSTPNPDSSVKLEEAEIFQSTAGCGLRYIYGWYMSGMLCQGYLLGYYQYSNLHYMASYEHTSSQNSTQDDYDVDINYNSHGFAGGAGIEVAFSSYFGIFGEYTNGYSKAFPAGKNSEAGCFRFGVTIRTSYL